MFFARPPRRRGPSWLSRPLSGLLEDLNPAKLFPMQKDVHPQQLALEMLGLLLLFFTVGVWLSSLTVLGLMAGAELIGGAFEDFLLKAGMARLMRRCLMGWAALLVIILLRRAGWRGWRDSGWLARATLERRRSWWRWILIGAGLGLLVLGSLILLRLLLGEHQLVLTASGGESLRRAFSFLASGLVVALLEETVCRGMLFRVFARAWRVWPAALVTSLLFALAHFLSPDPQAFHGSSFWQTTLNITLATYTTAGARLVDGLPFINLTLLGLVFCGCVAQTRTIWLGVGAHASLVWGVKAFAFWTDPHPARQSLSWLGQQNDFMDAPLVTALLGSLGIWLLARASCTAERLSWQGLSWRVTAGARARVAAWLAETAGPEKILKEDYGCRVTARAGLVLKSYWPKAGWAGIRFALRAPRTRRAFRLGQALRALGMPTPLPLAWATRRGAGFLRSESLLVTEAVESEALTHWLQRDLPAVALRARVLAAYGSLAAMFHRHGYSNRDLKHENVLCARQAPWELQVVDLDGVRHLRLISRRRAGRDLRRVGKSLAALGWAGAEEQRAFFTAYNAAVPRRLQRRAFPL